MVTSLQTYESKQALIDEIRKTYGLFVAEFDTVLEAQLHRRVDEVDRTPAEMIAYQLGWLNLIMSWEKDELEGKQVVTPTPDYKWNQLGPLYQSFYEQYQDDSLAELRLKFQKSVDRFCLWIDGLSEQELFDPGVRKWAMTAAMWPVWKWIHINSVAPFKTFRTKIRKWKKVVTP